MRLRYSTRVQHQNKRDECKPSLSLLDTKLSSVAVVSGSLDSLSYSNFQSSLILNHTVPLEWLRDWGVWSTGSVAKIPNGLHTVRWP